MMFSAVTGIMLFSLFLFIPISCHIIFYLRQVNEVNGGDNVFVRCVSVCVYARARAADR